MHIIYCDPSHGFNVVISFGEVSATSANHTVTLEKPKANELLATMIDLVQQHPWDAIVVVNKAESFTAIRVLATIANALAYSKHLKLYELANPVTWPELAQALGEPQELIQPHYSKAPNITIKPVTAKA